MSKLEIVCKWYREFRMILSKDRDVDISDNSIDWLIKNSGVSRKNNNLNNLAATWNNFYLDYPHTPDMLFVISYKIYYLCEYQKADSGVWEFLNKKRFEATTILQLIILSHHLLNYDEENQDLYSNILDYLDDSNNELQKSLFKKYIISNKKPKSPGGKQKSEYNTKHIVISTKPEVVCNPIQSTPITQHFTDPTIIEMIKQSTAMFIPMASNIPTSSNILQAGDVSPFTLNQTQPTKEEQKKESNSEETDNNLNHEGKQKSDSGESDYEEDDPSDVDDNYENQEDETKEKPPPPDDQTKQENYYRKPNSNNHLNVIEFLNHPPPIDVFCGTHYPEYLNCIIRYRAGPSQLAIMSSSSYDDAWRYFDKFIFLPEHDLRRSQFAAEHSDSSDYLLKRIETIVKENSSRQSSSSLGANETDLIKSLITLIKDLNRQLTSLGKFPPQTSPNPPAFTPNQPSTSGQPATKPLPDPTKMSAMERAKYGI